MKLNIGAQKQKVSASRLHQVKVDLARALEAHKSGDLYAAEKGYTRVLKQAPAQPDALNHLGIIRADRQETDAAIDLMALAARQRPKDANILANLGKAYLQARRFDEAIEALERAIGLKPNFPEALGNLIRALRLSGQTETAFTVIGMLTSITGGSLMAQTEHARLLSDIGETDAAGVILSEVIREYPHYAPAWLALAKSRKWKPEDQFVNQLVSQIDSTDDEQPENRALFYAAGKVLDDLGEYDRAFVQFSKAKELESEHTPYDHTRTVNVFDSIKRTLTSQFYQQRKNMGHPSQRPVFIVGMPRSGTSLTEQMLASHPDIFGAGELEYIAQARKALPTLLANPETYPAALLNLSSSSVSVLAMRYLRKLNFHNSSAQRVIDKMPHNFIALGLIALMFPSAKIIHSLRDPLDTCLSCYMQEFTQSHAYNRSLKDLGLYYSAYRDLMTHYSNVLPMDIYRSNYEDAIEDQASHTRALLSHIGLPWDDAVLNFHDTDRRVGTPSNWQVRQPIYKTSAKRWKNYESHLGPLLEAINLQESSV